jgi:hypothetical protein
LISQLAAHPAAFLIAHNWLHIELCWLPEVGQRTVNPHGRGRFRLLSSLFFVNGERFTSIRTHHDELKRKNKKQRRGAARVARAHNSKIFIFLYPPKLQ